MPSPRRVVVLGNCQAQLVECYLAAAGPVTVLPCPPVFEMNDGMRPALEEAFRSADVIVAQRVSDDYPLTWMRTSHLRAAFGERLVTWPNVYFDGYFPDVQYLYRAGWNKVESPLHDYHFGSVIGSYTAGASVADAVSAVERTGAGEDPFAASLERLRAREAGLDVPISDLVAASVPQRRAFYTPNHPYAFVMVELSRRLAVAAGLPFDEAAANAGGYRLDRIYIPVHRAIQRTYRLGFDHIPLYRGFEVLGCRDCKVLLGRPRSFQLPELITGFFRIYDAVLGR